MSDALRWAEANAALLAENHALAVIELRARLDAMGGGERVKDWYSPKGHPDEPVVDDPAEDEAPQDE